MTFLAAQGRDDAEGAGVVAAHGDRHPARVHRVALGGQRGGEDLKGFEDFQLGFVVVPGTFQQGRQGADVVGPEDHVHPRGLLQDRFAVLLGQAAPDGDLHLGAFFLGLGEHAEVSVELVVGVFPDRTGIEDHHVGDLIAGFLARQAAGFQQAGQPLGIVDIHLASVGPHLVGARRYG